MCHGTRTGPHCADCRDQNPVPSPDAIRFLAVLQHIPLDISSSYHGGILLGNLRDYMSHDDLVRLSTLACDKKTVRVILEVDS